MWISLEQCSDKTKVEHFGVNEKHYVWRQPNTRFQYENLIPSVKHGVGSITIWVWFAVSGPRQLGIMDGAKFWVLQVNSTGKCQEAEQKVDQEDNDPKHHKVVLPKWLRQSIFFWIKLLVWERHFNISVTRMWHFWSQLIFLFLTLTFYCCNEQFFLYQDHSVVAFFVYFI